MTVLWNERTTPLTLNSSNTTFSNNINLAYDFTGRDSSHMSGVPWIFGGGTSPNLNLTGTQTLSTYASEPGIVGSASSLYDYTNTTDYGLQTGTGDFTIGIRMTTGSVLPTGSNTAEIMRISGSAGTAFSVSMVENPSNGWYFTGVGSTVMPLGANDAATIYPINTRVMVWISRISNVVQVWTQNVTAQTSAVRRNPGGSAAGTLGSTWAARLILNFTSATPVSGAMHSFTHWSTGLTSTQFTAIGKDFYDTQANGALADTIAITSPTASSTIGATTTISGTYVGTTPSGVEVQFGSNGWVAGTGMTIGSGNWTGAFALTPGGPSTLQAREANNTAILSSTVASITVVTSAIFFGGNGLTVDEAVDYRIFQRSGSNQATVRLKGTYIGSPTSIEYQYDGGAWTVLVASPSGGTFNQTVVLTGPSQGTLSVRFSNSTSIVSSLNAVGVGDVFMVAGQSNHVGGGAGTYIPAVAPGGHTGWKASILDKTGRWRENVETSTDPFSKTTNASIYGAASATYSVQAQSATAYNSYFGKLATLFMAAGIPVAFVPSALGSTNIAAWAVSTSTTTLYGAMLARATAIGVTKVLWWQGEQDCTDGTTKTSYQTSLGNLVNDWCGTRFPGAKWVLMNLNATGVSAGTGGTSGTDTGLNAIRAAISAVASGNSNVSGIADMNGAFNSSIHYATGSEIDTVASRAYTAMTIVPATTASLTLTSRTGTPRASLSGLKWAFFDQMPGSFAAPVAQGSAGTTNASGVLSVSISGTTLLPSSVGWLTVTNSSGTVSTADFTFSGPVAVT